MLNLVCSMLFLLGPAVGPHEDHYERVAEHVLRVLTPDKAYGLQVSDILFHYNRKAENLPILVQLHNDHGQAIAVRPDHFTLADHQGNTWKPLDYRTIRTREAARALRNLRILKMVTTGFIKKLNWDFRPTRFYPVHGLSQLEANLTANDFMLDLLYFPKPDIETLRQGKLTLTYENAEAGIKLSLPIMLNEQ